MSTWRRNSLRAETIQRLGTTTGLPLFESISKTLQEPIKSRFLNAPRAIPLATDTRKLGHIQATFDEIKLGDRQQKVLDCIREIGPASNSEIAMKLDWPINQVVGRTFELRTFGLVVKDIKRQCRITGMVVQTWRSK